MPISTQKCKKSKGLPKTHFMVHYNILAIFIAMGYAVYPTIVFLSASASKVNSKTYDDIINNATMNRESKLGASQFGSLFFSLLISFGTR